MLPSQAKGTDLALPIRMLLLLSLLSLAPAILVTMTAFTRIVIVLGMLRHAIGMQETPPNQVLVSLALYRTGEAAKPWRQPGAPESAPETDVEPETDRGPLT